MTKTATIFDSNPQTLTIAVLVLPHSSILEVASTLDPMRNANRQAGRDLFRWHVVSIDGAAVPLTCGIELPSQGPLPIALSADVLIVIAGFRQAEVATRPLIQELHHIAPRFLAIGGIDAGPWVLARAGLLNGYRATVHWEDLEDLANAHPKIEVLPNRFVIDKNRFTAGGAAPACDMMLHLIATRFSQSLARQVAASFITKMRAGHEGQTQHDSASAHSPKRGLDPRVLSAVALIADNLESPISTGQMARSLGLSARRLESLFAKDLDTTPGAFALNHRLSAARRMITDTHHNLTEVALRCGFSSASTLSRAFKRKYGTAPSAARHS